MAVFEAGAAAAAKEKGGWNGAKAGKVATTALGAGFMSAVSNRGGKNGGGGRGGGDRPKSSGGKGGGYGAFAAPLAGVAGDLLLKQLAKRGSGKK